MYFQRGVPCLVKKPRPTPVVRWCITVESRYLMHILCECDENGKYKKNGEIQFPPVPSFETDEKRKAVVLKRFHDVPFGAIKL